MDHKKKFIVDFHIHSRFSRATSKNLVPGQLEYWAKIKGIDVVGTGDCVHPGWLAELKEKLEPAGNGLFRLKKEYKLDFTFKNKNIPRDIFFILSGEISNIYKKDGKVRKVHNLCVFPDFDTVKKIQRSLKGFNIESDGRPILGLDSKYLLEMVLSSSDKSFLVPAHIWTPWFSVLGSKSGFDNIKDCYEDLTPHIFALETGLSSDPAMNWTCGFLNDFKLISNSDAHSPEKLGREANIFETGISYNEIYNALKGNTGFAGTIEFFPQEGKYHYDGHRKCGVSLDPLATLAAGGLCPACGKPLTKGVMYRVAELADREGSESFANKRAFHSITPLPDLLAELMKKKSSAAKNIQLEYLRLIDQLGSEFHILLSSDTDEVRAIGGELLAEGILRLRSGHIFISEGFDGEYGRIKVFDDGEIDSFAGSSLFTTGLHETPQEKNIELKAEISSVKFNIQEFQKLKNKLNKDIVVEGPATKTGLDAEQASAVGHFNGPCMVLAGPGSGKTRILTERIIELVEKRKVKAENILAVTFTNKAADEMRQRVNKKIPETKATICTFHALGLAILKKYFQYFERPEHFYIVDQEEKSEIIETMKTAAGLDKNKKSSEKKLLEIERFKQGISDEIDPALFYNYNRELVIRGAFDLDDLIYLPVLLFSDHPDILKKYTDLYRWILVDEYQDINARQYELLMLLAPDSNSNLFVIGDPDQSIYGFRGSDIRYIDMLKIRLPDIKKVNLNNSYRCPSNVIKAAADIIGKEKYLSGKNESVKIIIQKSETEKSEADWIAQEIERLIGGVRSFSIDSGISDGDAPEDSGGFSDFAVLCRTSLMFPPIIKSFTDHGIAYQVIGTEPFYCTRPFSTIIADFRKTYYHIANNESSALRGFDKTRIMIENKENITKIIDSILEYKEITLEERELLQELALPYSNDYERFFLNLATKNGADYYDEKAEAVSLLTIHASKGLEFGTVFIPGCEEGVIPFELFGKKNKDELSEEERLFYVGMTRTGKNLYLTHAKKRSLKGRVIYPQRSRFLDRLENDLLKIETRKKKKTDDDNQLKLFDL